MIPVLVVDGVAHKVIEIRLWNDKPLMATVEENGVYKIYYDKAYAAYAEGNLRMDLVDAISWEGRYEPAYESIESLIEDKQKELADLASQIADSSIENTFVPPKLIEQYKKLKQRIFGLMDAQDIIQEFIMVEDVDLSGGEDIE